MTLTPPEMSRKELEYEVRILRAALEHLGGEIRGRSGLLSLLASWDPLDEALPNIEDEPASGLRDIKISSWLGMEL